MHGEMARVLCDEECWPLVLVTWPERPVTDEDLETYLQESARHLQRGRHVVLHLADGASGLSSRQRKRMASYIKQHRTELRQKVLCGAIVLEKPVLRAIVTAVNWLAPPASPQRIFAHREEAQAWLEQVLTDAGLEAPPPNDR